MNCNKDITDFTKTQIQDILKTDPVLIGNTSSDRLFFETDYEYDTTNCDLIGTPVIDDILQINSWEDVQIKNDKGEIQYLVSPDIYKFCTYTVYLKVAKTLSDETTNNIPQQITPLSPLAQRLALRDEEIEILQQLFSEKNELCESQRVQIQALKDTIITLAKNIITTMEEAN